MARRSNPLIENLVGGFGGGLGFGTAAVLAKNLLETRSRKRNPVTSSPSITQTKMGLDEVLHQLKGSGYDFYDNYNRAEDAVRAATNLESQGYEAKVVLVPVPLAKTTSPHPHWVLRRRKLRNPRRRGIRKRQGGLQ